MTLQRLYPWTMRCVNGSLAECLILVITIKHSCNGCRGHIKLKLILESDKKKFFSVLFFFFFNAQWEVKLLIVTVLHDNYIYLVSRWTQQLSPTLWLLFLLLYLCEILVLIIYLSEWEFHWKVSNLFLIIIITQLTIALIIVINLVPFYLVLPISLYFLIFILLWRW